MRWMSARMRLLATVLMSMILPAMASLASAKTTVTFVVWGEGGFLRYHDFWEAKKRFEALNPDIEIEILQGSGSLNEYIERVLIMNASGADIDVITAMPHWDVSLAQDSITRDLAPFMERDGISASDFVQGTIQGFTLGSKVWGLPLGALVYGSAYNARLLNEAGYAPPGQHDWTWDHVRDVARKLTLDRDGDGAIDQYGVAIERAPSTNFFYGLAYQAGGMFYDQFIDPKVSYWNTPEVREAVAYYLSFYEDGYAPFQTHAYSAHWIQDKAAFLWLNASSTWGSYAHLDRTLGHHDVVTVLSPKGPVRGGWQMTAYGVQMVSSTKNPEAAWKWMKYLSTSTEEVIARYETGEVLMSSYLKNVPLFLDYGDAVVDPQIWVDIASDPNNTPRYSMRSGREINNLADRLLTDVVAKKMGLSAALEEIHRVSTVLLNEAHSK